MVRDTVSLTTAVSNAELVGQLRGEPLYGNANVVFPLQFVPATMQKSPVLKAGQGKPAQVLPLGKRRSYVLASSESLGRPETTTGGDPAAGAAKTRSLRPSQE